MSPVAYTPKSGCASNTFSNNPDKSSCSLPIEPLIIESTSDIHHDLTPSTPIDGPNQTPKETPAETPTSSGGGYSGPSMEDIKAMMQEMFSSYENAWTPSGYGWGGTNSNAVRINRSQGSRRGTSYAGNKSSFNRSGSRLNSGTPWMNTLGM